MRAPFQGVRNIIRFNWHFYAMSLLAIFLLWGANLATQQQYTAYAVVLSLLIALPILLSLCVSAYVYDLSGFYSLSWLKRAADEEPESIANVNAGFDEISALLQARYAGAALQVFDFYDPEKHTEVSIKRARKAYPPYPNTILINPSQLPLANGSIDMVFVILAAHEIRQEAERIEFFKEVARVLRPAGRIIVTEHLRDLPNFLAYTIGAFHFLTRSSWHRVFEKSDLEIMEEQRVNPFVTTFILAKDGISS